MKVQKLKLIENLKYYLKDSTTTTNIFARHLFKKNYSTQEKAIMLILDFKNVHHMRCVFKSLSV